MSPPSSYYVRLRLCLALAILVAGMAAGCGPLQSGPDTEDVQRAMTWYLKKVYVKQFAFPGGNNFFVPGQGAKLTVEQNGAQVAAPPFVYAVTKRYTKSTGGERWHYYEFTATGHLDAGDVTFHGVVALVKRGNTWFFHRGDGAPP